jgi:hypothetical protein
MKSLYNKNDKPLQKKLKKTTEDGMISLVHGLAESIF